MSGRVGVEALTDEDRARRTVTVRELGEQFLGDVEGVHGYAAPRVKSLKNYRRDARRS